MEWGSEGAASRSAAALFLPLPSFVSQNQEEAERKQGNPSSRNAKDQLQQPETLADRRQNACDWYRSKTGAECGDTTLAGPACARMTTWDQLHELATL